MGCDIKRDANGQVTSIICGRGRRAKKCHFCHKREATKLCDFPLVGSKTCDADMCGDCAARVGPDRDYCPNHASANVKKIDSRSLVQVAWDELQSETCFCGAKKRKKQSFCSKCYYSLPKDRQRELYTPMSAGYAVIFDECKELLKGLLP